MDSKSVDYVLKYFPTITEKQIKQFAQLPILYADWNSKINVISRKDIENLAINHVLHSLAIAKVLSFTDGTQLLDVGTGGGFPGIPLSIMFPNCKFHLIDRVGKKITVVKAVAESIGLQNVTAEHVSVEELKIKYDFVISRAVTRFDAFYRLTHSKIRQGGANTLANGILYLKGGDFEDELNAISNLHIYNISDYFEEEFFETKKVIHAAV